MLKHLKLLKGKGKGTFKWFYVF